MTGSVTVTAREISAAKRWGMLAAGTTAQCASAIVIHGPAFLIPALHDDLGMSLAAAGVVAAAPMVGVMLTLVLWGWWSTATANASPW